MPIIFALNKMRVSSITLSNRTTKKAEDLQKFSNEKMLKKNTKAGILNEENFDEIETQLENNEE